MLSLARELEISIPAVSDSAARGQRIAEAKGFRPVVYGTFFTFSYFACEVENVL
jgi:hypothetical protein